LVTNVILSWLSDETPPIIMLAVPSATGPFSASLCE